MNCAGRLDAAEAGAAVVKASSDNALRLSIFILPPSGLEAAKRHG